LASQLTWRRRDGTSDLDACAGFFVFDKNTDEMLCERAYWDMETVLS